VDWSRNFTKGCPVRYETPVLRCFPARRKRQRRPEEDGAAVLGKATSELFARPSAGGGKGGHRRGNRPAREKFHWPGTLAAVWSETEREFAVVRCEPRRRSRRRNPMIRTAQRRESDLGMKVNEDGCQAESHCQAAINPTSLRSGLKRSGTKGADEHKHLPRGPSPRCRARV